MRSVARSHLTDDGERGHQPEAADQEGAFLAGQAVVGLAGDVAQHEAVLGQLGGDGVDGVLHPLVGSGEEAEQGGEQRGGVERVGVVVLAEDAAVADAVSEDVGADLLGGLGPGLLECGGRRGSRPVWRPGPGRPSPSASTTRSVGVSRGLPRFPGPAGARRRWRPRPGTARGATGVGAGVGYGGCAAGSSRVPLRRRRSGAGRTRRSRSVPGGRPRSRTARLGSSR